MGPGGLRATFLSAFEKEDGFLIPVATPAFFKSDGFKGNEVGLSSDDCLRSRASTGLSGGLTGTLGGLVGGLLAPVISDFFSPAADGSNGFFQEGEAGLSRTPAWLSGRRGLARFPASGLSITPA